MTASLTAVSTAKTEPKASVVSASRRRVFALASKGRYRRPEVATFPIDGMKISGPVTMAGNTGG
ncbi:hypothetical protein [Methylocystis echinoides]|uniref:Uncharacterized protein n=1 Tax=Methylocystis echinoides TaxID=29468 RepID=A0A9W6GUD0_9HYPH|nr:hypothetical protein [Methylocystis echinoides]GLI93049.1 hypothetical protein LMG27198_20410 [Methylocystis echinoides]